MTAPRPASEVDRLAVTAAQYVDDPLRYALFAWPWGVEGTPFARYAGPEPWQRQVLAWIGEDLRARKSPIRISVSSGHGVGKSALAAMLMDWALLAPHTRGVATANTEKQLRTKTWPTLATWHESSICRPLYHLENSSYSARGYDATWRIDAVPWSERNTEAFAGLHNLGRRVLVVFDEASSIPDAIWEVTEGALTDADTQVIWVAFGNPTRNTGRFRETFGRDAAIWRHLRVDSRSVSFTNKDLIGDWATRYGEDSDFFRVRVRGEFPNQSDLQFIPSAFVEEARRREAFAHSTEPLVAGLDVARQGGDESVLALRRGRDARSIPWLCVRERDSMVLASRIVEYLNDLARRGLRITQLFVDAGGVGGPVADRLRQLGVPAIDVNFGGKPDGARAWECRDKGAEMWRDAKDWLRVGGAIPDDPELADQLVSRESSFTSDNRLYMESKDDMRRRGVSSPDRADGLVLTLAYPVHPSIVADSRGAFHAAGSGRAAIDYEPYGERDDRPSGGRAVVEYDPWGGR